MKWNAMEIVWDQNDIEGLTEMNSTSHQTWTLLENIKMFNSRGMTQNNARELSRYGYMEALTLY